MVTVDSLIFAVDGDEAKVLLIKRGGEPFKGQWAIPGGFVEIDEELKDAAARELAEETSLTGIELEQMHTFGTVGRDPRGRQITIVYVGTTCPENMGVKGGDDAEEARWFDVNALPQCLAFDHRDVIAMAIERRL
jgi:8-oxo-dGTP diphosphatase